MKVINFTDGSYLSIATLDPIEFPANELKLVGQSNAYFFVGGDTRYATLLTPVHTHYRIDKEGNIWTFRVDGNSVQFSITDPSFNVIISSTLYATGQWTSRAAYFCICGETDTQYQLEIVNYFPIVSSYDSTFVSRWRKVINNIDVFNDTLNNHTEPSREATNTITGDEFAEFLYGRINTAAATYTEDDIFRGRPWTGTATRGSRFYLNKSLFDDSPSPGPTPPEPGNDPFSPGGTSTTGGGGMTGDPPPHDSVDFPITPSANALNAGFISIWTPSEEQIQSLAAWLWTTDLTKIATWQKLIQNPLDLIFGLSIVPVPIHHTDDDTPATEEEIVALNDPMTLGWIDTGIGIDWITDQYVEIDCGSIDMDEYWNAYLDYAPYTKMSIYLPYIGVKELNVNDCMNRTISLKYKIDLASGSCVAIIKCDDSVYYHFGGNCASSIPITATQMQEVIRNAVTTAVAVGATAAAVGSGAAPTVIAASAGASAASAARSVMSGVDYHRSGANGGTTGLMSVQTPYLILTRPRQAVPENQNTYTGYPSFITEQIGDLEGYTEVEIIHMHNLTCTSEEFEEIDELLLKGVII